MLEDQEQQLQAQQQRCDKAKERLDWLVKTLSTVRAGVEHLADKLQHITLVNTTSAIKTWFFSSFLWKFLPTTKLTSVHPSYVSLQSDDIVAAVSPDSDEFIVELMTQCELKLQLLLKELEGKDLAAIMKEMEEEEVRPSSMNSQAASRWFKVQVVSLDAKNRKVTLTFCVQFE